MQLANDFAARSRALTRKDPADAAEIARLGSLVARRIDDPASLTLCHVAHAEAAVVGAEFETALTALEAADEILGHRPDARLARDGALLRVHALANLDRCTEARAVGEAALASYERAGDEQAQVMLHVTLADIAFRMDRPREALRHFRATDTMLSADASRRLVATIASNRANALEACNRFRAATRHFERARELFAAEGCDHTVAQVDYNTAYAEALRGRFQDALERYGRAESEFERLGDERHLAHVDLDRAEIHLHLNLPQDAARFAASAEERFRRLGLRKECAQAQLFAGRAAELGGEPGAAEGHYAGAERGFGELGLTERQLACRVQRACAAERAGRDAAARRLADDAEELLGARMNPLSRASLQLLRARLELASGKGGEALERALAVARDCRRIHAPWVQIEAHRVVGEAHVLAGDRAAAVVAFELAIEHLEGYRGGVPPDEYMSAFLAGRSGLYERAVELFVATGQIQRGFDFAERAKSRALVDLLAGRRATQGASDRTPSRVRHLRDKLTALYRRLFRGGDEPESRSARSIRAIRNQAADLEDELAHLLRDDRLLDRQTRSLGAVETLGVDAIRADLEDGVALVEFFLTETQLFTFVVTRDDVRVVRRPTSEHEIRPLLRRFHFHLSKFQRPEVVAEELVMRATRNNLRKLAAIVLEPIAAHLTSGRLVIVPHGVLHHLPFHALPWGGDGAAGADGAEEAGEGWVADHFEIVYAPSAAVYALCGESKPEAREGASIFGLPDEQAPQIEDEAHRVAAVLGTDHVYLREHATFDRLREEVRHARFVHIATHGMFRPEQPMLSSIRLADRWVNLYDLYDLDVRGELVVLSTCESGTAGVTRGDEILGLTRGFLYAGAPALLTSQWRVHDAVTTELMDSFYKHLEALGDAARALKLAMADIRASHPHPYFWAPFFLTGRPVSHPVRPRPRAATAAGAELAPLLQGTTHAATHH